MDRSIERAPEIPSGDPWTPAFDSVREYLADLPELGDSFEIRRGARRENTARVREEPPNRRRRPHRSPGATQFAPAESAAYPDVREEDLPGNAGDFPRDRPKLIVNAVGLGKGPWRIAAAANRRGLVLARRSIGLWPRRSLSDSELPAFAAILNGPVANAFVATRNPANRIRISELKRIPIPRRDLFLIGELAAAYTGLLAGRKARGKGAERMARLLTEIDAAVLGAYNMPARLEKQLLACFRGAKRPVAHAWRHWDEAHPMPGLTLAERLSGRYRPHGSWILDVFRPLPEDEAKFLREYGVL